MENTNTPIYIGIGGHKGAGRPTFTFLLDKTLQYMIDNWEIVSRNELPKLHYMEYICNYIDIIQEDQNFLRRHGGSNDVYLTSFIDIMKFFVCYITNVDFNWLVSEENKDRLYINIYNFDISTNIDIERNPVITPEYMIRRDWSDKYITTDMWMKMDDFYTYMGKKMFKERLGKNIWSRLILKEDNQDNSTISSYKFKIYYDIKYQSEMDFIRDKEGVCIYINRPTNDQTPEDSDCDVVEEYDIKVDVEEGIQSMIDDIWKIARNLMRMRKFKVYE